MIIEKDKIITWCPPLNDRQGHGWLIIDKWTWTITNWHSFDDFGQTIETVRAERKGKEIEVYSMDEGLTWVSDLD